MIYKKLTLDTTVIAKGLVPPRRKKMDGIYDETLRLHNLARDILDKIESGDYNLYIPSIALVETGAVVSRITHKKHIAKDAISFLKGVSADIFYDYQILDHAIDTGIETKASGFDTIFITCPKLTNSILITDDKRMFEIGNRYGIESKLLRNMVNDKI